MPVTSDSDANAPDLPAAYVRTLVAAVTAAGRDPRELLEPEGLSVSDVDKASRMPAELFGKLYLRGMWLLDDESLGMVSAGAVRAGTFKMMCLALIGCPTLGAVVERAGEFLDVVDSPGVKPIAVLDGDSVSITFGSPARLDPAKLDRLLATADPVHVRTSLYYWHNLLGWFAGRSLGLTRVDFAFANSPTGYDWRGLFGAPVEFGASSSRLVLPRRVLSLPNVQSELTLTNFLRETPYRLVVPSFVRPSLQDRLRALFAQMPGDVPPTSEEIASRVGMSVSTLRRKLAAEGVSWQQLKEESRRSAALRYVADTDLPIAEVARLLGFDEASTFFRAFRRWTGTTPSRYREAMAASAQAKD